MSIFYCFYWQPWIEENLVLSTVEILPSEGTLEFVIPCILCSANMDENQDKSSYHCDDYAQNHRGGRLKSSHDGKCMQCSSSLILKFPLLKSTSSEVTFL